MTSSYPGGANARMEGASQQWLGAEPAGPRAEATQGAEGQKLGGLKMWGMKIAG